MDLSGYLWPSRPRQAHNIMGYRSERDKPSVPNGAELTLSDGQARHRPAPLGRSDTAAASHFPGRREIFPCHPGFQHRVVCSITNEAVIFAPFVSPKVNT